MMVVEDGMASAGPNATEVVDALLVTAWQRGATAIWLEPSGRDDAHRVSIERGRAETLSTSFGESLGDAVVARFALMSELDLLSRQAQTGRCGIRVGGERFDLVVTLRPTDTQLCGEVRILRDVDREVGARLASAIEDDLAPGTSVGAYRIIDELGEGGMGIVYRVEHTMLRRQFAMKVLRGELMAVDPTSADKFVGEARAAARVSDPGIVDVTDFGELPDGRPYLVMELVHGRSLSDYIDEVISLPADHAVSLVRRIARALHAAHAYGVVHRDLTPSNVFLQGSSSNLQVKLVDFGAARVIDTDDVEERSEFVFGTPCYLSPEQAQGYPGDVRADLYALGIIFFELITGDVPFDGADVRTVVRKQVFDPVPEIRSAYGPLPDGLQSVIMRCLRKNPADRYQSVSELIQALDRVSHGWERKGWRRWLPA